jgi:hypothetical protein
VLGFLKLNIMALFICGLFTGMATMIAFGMWLNHKEKRKREQAKHQTAKVYWDAYWRSFHATFTSGKATELEEQLVLAIKAEDYEEAARIRDLMNRK